MVWRMSMLPLLSTDHALFLDFDGTLAELAPRPEAVRVAAGLVATLSALQAHLGGALAIVTGRPEGDIDAFLAPWRPALASEHGARYRLAGGASRALLAPPDWAPLLAAAKALAARHAGLLVEAKSAGLALHFRLAPQLEHLCRETLAGALQALPAVPGGPGLELLPGKGLVEVKLGGVHKGRAIADLLTLPPFAGRSPVFAGDDVGDEPGFACVQALGGCGIKVGEGPSLARHRCPSPVALRDWLAAARNAWDEASKADERERQR